MHEIPFVYILLRYFRRLNSTFRCKDAEGTYLIPHHRQRLIDKVPLDVSQRFRTIKRRRGTAKVRELPHFENIHVITRIVFEERQREQMRPT